MKRSNLAKRHAAVPHSTENELQEPELHQHLISNKFCRLTMDSRYGPHANLLSLRYTVALFFCYRIEKLIKFRFLMGAHSIFLSQRPKFFGVKNTSF